MNEDLRGNEPPTSEDGENLHINTIVIPADLTERLWQSELPADGLEERQRLVSGDLQVVNLGSPPACLYCNEGGKLLELQPNKRATLLLWVHNPQFLYRDYIAGDAFLVGPLGGNDTDGSVAEEYLQKLFEATRFRVEERQRGESAWRERPERFGDWMRAYENAVGWGTGIARPELEVRVLPDESQD